MRYAIFSDIHNEVKALSRVLAHAQKQHVDAYFCLGDVGVDNCVDLIHEVEALTVFGNWEVSGWQYLNSENQAWVLELPPIRQNENFWLTHAAPLWPDTLKTLADFLTHKYEFSMSHLFPYLHYKSDSLWESFAILNENKVPLMFHGHTHRQMIWQFTAENQLKQSFQRMITVQPGDSLIVGVGSVGRPMDDVGAAYVIYDDETNQIQFFRVR